MRKAWCALTRHWNNTRIFSPDNDRLPDRGRVLILSPCENIHEMFEPARGYHVVRGKSASLSAEFIESVNPDVIAAPVMGPEHDIMEIAQTLRALGFRGTLCAVSKPPIRADLVIAELRRACPGLDLCSVQILSD